MRHTNAISIDKKEKTDTMIATLGCLTGPSDEKPGVESQFRNRSASKKRPRPERKNTDAKVAIAALLNQNKLPAKYIN